MSLVLCVASVLYLGAIYTLCYLGAYNITYNNALFLKDARE